MAWIQSDQSLPNHPKTKRATRVLGLSVPAFVGHLHCLWYWALDYAPDGDLSGFESWEIADAALFDGDPELFIRALLDCGKDGPGFFEMSDSGLLIHDWYDYAGRLIERREQNAERMRKRRAEHVQGTCDTRTGAREEKRREENKENKEEDGSSQPVDNLSVDGLVAMCRNEVGGWQSDEAKDPAIVRRCVARLGLERMQGLIIELATHQEEKPANKRYKNPRQALAQWCTKEKPTIAAAPCASPRPAVLVPKLTDEERAASIAAAKEAAEKVRSMTAGIGKGM